ncbi:Zn(2)-C6 fungal-type DNA-binding domain [Penicillium roqueforti FM164]|uniref:Zn(2)-C6 fungal-type DNA-binding domain n=1 Tax=Penicillium roqueforti (strain FM164) TaxID=1365484 RepID=W6QLZ0_PENRF|nr:Zn(2)-C6 fungal-type DNA-binding domain [Penicillium roqueforti FM164]
MNMLVHDLVLAHLACDRYHGQKLHCRRESNSSTCVRCARAGVRCTPRQMRFSNPLETIRYAPDLY